MCPTNPQSPSEPESPRAKSKSPPERHSRPIPAPIGRPGRKGRWTPPSLRETAGMMVWDALPRERPFPASPRERPRVRLRVERTRRATIARAHMLADARLREIAEAALPRASSGGLGYD